jgi:hypothetical protein
VVRVLCPSPSGSGIRQSFSVIYLNYEYSLETTNFWFWHSPVIFCYLSEL